MDGASIIKEFLVGLGFKIDEAGFKRFATGINMATKVATGLGKASTAAAGAVEVAVTKISKGFEDLYWASMRINASVENIRATDYAITQMGGSAQGARAAMEGIAEFMRSNPGGERFLRGLGVETREANGELRDTSEIMRDLGTQFRNMPYYAAKVRAGMLGIDERTLQAMIRGTGQFSDRYHRMAESVGVDQQAAAKASHDFMVDMRDLLTLLQLTGEKVILLFQPIAHDVVAVLIAAHQATHGWSTGLIEVAAVLGPVLWLLKPLGRMLFEAMGGMEALGAAAEAAGVLLSGPVGWILAIVAAIAAVLLSSEKFRREFTAAFAEAVPAVRDALADVGQAFGELVAALRPLIDLIGRGLSWLRDRFVDAFGPVVIGALKNGVQFIVTDLRLLADTIRLIVDLLTGHWSKAWSDATKTARDAADGIRKIWDNLHGRGSAPAPPAPGKAPAPANQNAHPAAPGAAPPPPAPGQRSAGAQALTYFQSQGWTREQAAGLVANLAKESSLNAAAVGDHGHAFGLGQWHKDRQDAFRRWSGKDIQSSSFAEQLAFVNYELTQGMERRAGQMLRAARTAANAGAAVARYYERPANTDAEAAIRGRMAENWYARPNVANGAAAGRVEINQKTDIHNHGVSDPAAAGRETAHQQDRVNGDLLRNTKSALG